MDLAQYHHNNYRKNRVKTHLAAIAIGGAAVVILNAFIALANAPRYSPSLAFDGFVLFVLYPVG